MNMLNQHNAEIGDRDAAVPKELQQDAGRSPVAIEPKPPMPNLDMLAKGVAVGVGVSIIIHAGKQVVGTLIKNPVVVFGLGFAVGFLARHNRKKIIAVAGSASEQGKAFVLRQKENIKDMFVEADKNPDE